jgi:carbon storage regulator CsrA
VLVVSRKKHESIVVRIAGVDIKITLVEVKSLHAARIGIDAPPEALILREELLDRQQKPKAKPKPSGSK